MHADNAKENRVTVTTHDSVDSVEVKAITITFHGFK